MRIVSPLLKRVLYPTFSAAGIFRRISASGLAVVTYHGVVPQGYTPIDASLDGNLITSDALRRQIRLLKACYTVIDPEEILSWCEGQALPARAVLVTCDDGLLNNLTDMLPVLREEGVNCLFFVTGASAGEQRGTLWYEELFLLFLRAAAGPFHVSAAEVTISDGLASREQRRKVWWSAVKQLSQIDAESRIRFLEAARLKFGFPATQYSDQSDPTCRRFGLLTLAEVNELIAAGMTIGAHTMSHPLLSQSSPELAYSEIAECKRRMEAGLQRPVWAFAYPFGDPRSITREVLAIPKVAGYKAAFVNYGGGLGVDLPAYALPRIHVTSEMGPAEFEAHVSGFYARLQRSAGRTA